MSKSSVKQLQVVIERQEEQLKRYEARLRDVVQAYKGLQKEKSALEKSLNVLSPKKNDMKDDLSVAITTSKPLNSAENNEPKNTPNFSTRMDNTTAKNSNNSSLNEDSDSLTNLKSQVLTLRESLKTVMEQKTKMENSFQADKKKYLNELQVIEDTFAEDRNLFLKEKLSLQQEIQQLRTRTCHEQQARESEQNDHALMLKELQLVVSKERCNNEQLQTKLDELNKSLQEETQTNEQNAETPVSLDDQLNKSPTLLQLQEEMLEMKEKLEQDILTEQLRANDANIRAVMIAKTEEQRVADLEAKLSELSQVVGKYERLRSHDLIEIQKLKDRLYDINVENRQNEAPDNGKTGTSDDFDEVFQKVKDLLRSRVQDNDVTDTEISGISKTELEYILKNDPAHKMCQDELRQLKDEFECYKNKVQLSRSNTTSHDHVDNKDFDELRHQTSELRHTVEVLRSEIRTKENDFDLKMKEKCAEMDELCLSHNLELENERTIYKAKLEELQEQVQKQRNRTLGLISERESEIDRLKAKLSEVTPTSTTSMKYQDGVTRKTSDSDSAVRELLAQPSPSKLVHFAQEQAFCEAELEIVRKQRSDLEESIFDMRHREEQLMEQNKLLKEEIRKLERNKCRENANLEYVKNVVLRYLLTDSESVRHQMVAAIAHILQFSPKELSEVGKRSKTWWVR